MLSGVRVLVVEDEPLVALDLEATFRANGAHVTCATSITHAIDLIQCNLVDFAVLDTLLWQGQNSSAISEMLRLRDIPFAVFSAYRTLHTGAIAHIMKPVSSDAVIAVADQYLKVRQSRRS